MKKILMVIFIFVFMIPTGHAASALDDLGLSNAQLTDKQELLFTLDESDIKVPSDLGDLEYDKENGHLYMILKKEEPELDADTGLIVFENIQGYKKDPISGYYVRLVDGKMYKYVDHTMVESGLWYPIIPKTGDWIDPYTGKSKTPYERNPYTGLFVVKYFNFNIDLTTGYLIESSTGRCYLNQFNAVGGGGSFQEVEPATWYPIRPIDGEHLNPETGEVIEWTGNQKVYTLEGDLVKEFAYPILDKMDRRGIEFETDRAWMLDRKVDKSKMVLTDGNEGVRQEISVEAKSFVVQGDRVLYSLGCDGEIHKFALGTAPEFKPADIILSELSGIKAYDLSPDGSTLIYVGTDHYSDKNKVERDRNFLVFDHLNGEEAEEYCISDCIIRGNYLDNDYYSQAYDLYTTEEYIILLRKDAGAMKGYIERYDYEGKYVDGVEINYCARRITEGPYGSTIYIQKHYPESEGEAVSVQVMQINWDGKPSPRAQSAGRMKPIIKEKTRAGETVARFNDRQFGLLRVEEAETGTLDYQAPIRSTENQVKLQIPYCDIQAKCKSGARNLIVNYQDQTLTFPMKFFVCDEILSSMPCQNDATIEIIAKTDEAGHVTYTVQLFVVEQTSATTKVVHRKAL